LGLRRLRTGNRPFVQLGNHLQPRPEQPGAEWHRSFACIGRQFLVEELQILAIVKDVEELFILTRPIQVFAQAGAPANHLPELGLGADDLEEHQIDHLRHINAGVEHVHRDGDVRHAVLEGELINQALRVLGLVGHHASEGALVLGVIGIEALGNEVRMGVVLGKDDGLAQAVTASHFLALGHQVAQHLVHGVGVEQPLVQCGGVHRIGDVAFFVPLQCVPPFFLFFRQVLVLDALALVLEWHRNRTGWHQIALGHGFVQAIDIGGYATFQVKQPVGVVVNLVLGRGGQAHQHGVKVIKDGAVLLVHRAVRLVDDDEVKVADTKTALTVGGLVNQAHHGGVGRDKHPAIGVFLGHQIDRR